MAISDINKKTLVSLIIKSLADELTQAKNSANEAHSAAIDDQSIAETQYDTLAIEASYLAEGQSRRVAELHQALQAYQSLNLQNFNSELPIALTALIQLGNDIDKKHWFFMGPTAGGFRCELSQQNITVITPQSPIGSALIGQYQDDDIEIAIGSNQRKDYIAQVN